MEEMTPVDTTEGSLGAQLQPVEDGMECHSPEPHPLQDNGEDGVVWEMRLESRKGPVLRSKQSSSIAALLSIAEGKVASCEAVRGVEWSSHVVM